MNKCMVSGEVFNLPPGFHKNTEQVAISAATTGGILSTILFHGTRPLSVDYNLSVKNMIAVGRYDLVSSRIAADVNLSAYGTRECEAALFSFTDNVYPKQVATRVKASFPSQFWQAARIEHLLAFGAQYPEEQRGFPIIGTGSVIEICGTPYIPYLDGTSGRRSFGFSWLDYRWNPISRFLVVHEISMKLPLTPH